MSYNLDRVQRRAVQYWFVDGLAELGAGLVSLLLAVIFWFWESVFTGRWSLLAVFTALLAVSFGLRLLVQRIKSRTTYLQSGYAAPFTGLESRRSLLVLVAFVLLVLIGNAYLSISDQGLRWSPGLAGAVFAFLFAWAALATQLRRFYFLALLSGVVGLALPLLGLDYFRGVAVLAGAVGLVLLVQGYRVRRAYTLHNEPVDLNRE